jgi:hypothetical protein
MWEYFDYAVPSEKCPCMEEWSKGGRLSKADQGKRKATVASTVAISPVSRSFT